MLLNERLSALAKPEISEISGKTSKVEACAVCGDQATGYHYEVPSCNGCKTFFRRTITAHRSYKCHKNGNCIFNKDIRCACRACRFSKCIAVGMNPKAIQCNRTGRIALSSSAALQESSLLPEVPGCSRIEQSSDVCVKQEVPTSSFSNAELNSKIPYTVSALLGLSRGTDLNEPSDERRSALSTPQPERFFIECYEAIPAKKSRFEENEKTVDRFLKLEDHLWQLHSSKYEASESMLDLLCKPCAVDDIDSYKAEETGSKLSVTDSIDFDIALVIEYAKSFDIFQRMPLTDKIYLLRDVALVLALLQNAYHILNERSLQKLELTFCDDRSEESSKSENEATVLLASESLSRADLDKTEFVLFKAVVFLHAECFNLTGESYSELFKKRQEMLDILFDYILRKHGRQGPVKYGNVLSILWTLLRLSQNYRETMRRFDLKPLCREILSAKLPETLA